MRRSSISKGSHILKVERLEHALRLKANARHHAGWQIRSAALAGTRPRFDTASGN